MSVEYVMFETEELMGLKKSLLSSQLSVLNSLKSLQNYKKLRNEENTLKIKLKSLIDQTQEEIQVFKKILPETSYKTHKHAGQSNFLDHINNDAPSITSSIHETVKPKKNSIEQEIEEIRRKLSMLE